MKKFPIVPKNLTGYIVIITGSNIGIGLETARMLANMEATVILACRNTEKAASAAEDIIKSSGNFNVKTMNLDLSSFANVREFANEFLATYDRLDLLINNAGIVTLKQQMTNDGYEILYQVNYLSHFLLTNLLLSLIKKTADAKHPFAPRIINISSSAHNIAKFDINNLNAEKSYTSFINYGQSKLLGVMFTFELAKKLKDTGIVVHTVDPGVVKTAIHLRGQTPKIVENSVDFIMRFVGKTPEQGAWTCIYTAVSDEAGQITGKYWTDCKIQKANPITEDEELLSKLWTQSEQRVGLT
jgi:retinol dehydrogenase 14